MSSSSRTNTSSMARHSNVAFFEHENCERYGTYCRLFYEDRSLSNLQELEYAGRIARALKERGVRPGDRVLIVIPNSPDMTASIQAIWTAGAVVVPVSPQWSVQELAYALNNSGASVVLTIPPLARRMCEASQASMGSQRLLCFGETDITGFDNIVPEVADGIWISTPQDRAPSDTAMILYTSGTTSRPKGVVVTHENIPAAMDSVNSVNPALPRKPMLHVLPLHHIFGVLMYQLSNRWGFNSVLMNRFDPLAILQAIPRHKIGYVLAVPTMLVYLLHHPERAKYDLSSLYRIIAGGSSLPEALRLSFQQAFRCRVDQGYGMSETGFISCYGDHETYRAGSSGWPCPGFELIIVDDQNRSLPPLSVGEICIKGASVTPGYWNDPKSTRSAFRDNWFHTGDVGYVDADGYIYITDRKKDIIIKGGENISPREIEEIIYSHPCVAEAAVVAVPDSDFGEEICAVVQLRADASATESEIREHVARYVSKFKVPAYIVFQPALPKNSTGKIQKQILRDYVANLKAA